LERVEAYCMMVSAERVYFVLDHGRDLDRLGLGPASQLKPVADPGRPVERGLARTAQPYRDLPLRSRQYTIEPAPAFLRRIHQLEHHRERRLIREAALRADRAMPHGGKSALDRVRGRCARRL